MRKGVVLACLLLLAVRAAGQQAAVSFADSTAIKQLFFEGLRSKLADNYAESEASFLKIVAADSANAPAWYELSLLDFRQDKPEAALAAIKKAIAAEPGNPWYFRLLSELYKTSGNLAELIPVLDRLIELMPGERSLYRDKARALDLLEISRRQQHPPAGPR